MTKAELLNKIQNQEIDSYLIHDIDKKYLMDIDVLIMLYINDINFNDILDLCPDINKYKKVIETIKLKLLENKNEFYSMIPKDYFYYVGIEITDYYMEKNNLERFYIQDYDNEWFRFFLIPGFKELFESCKNGIPENFDKVCDKVLSMKFDDVSIKDELNNLNIWYKGYEMETAGFEFVDGFDLYNFKK